MVMFALLRGPKGDDGAAGAKGDTGDTGAQGEQGVQGDAGAAGANGTLYVDRGDPDAYDKTVGNFTTDGNWHDLDLSAIVPATAFAVHIKVTLDDEGVASNITIKKKGNTNYHNAFSLSTQVTGVPIMGEGVVACNGNQELEYSASNLTFDVLNFIVKGWFLPATP